MDGRRTARQRVPISLTVPGWLNEKTSQWIDRLSMREWSVEMQLAMAPGDNPECRGLTEEYPDINIVAPNLSGVSTVFAWQCYKKVDMCEDKHSKSGISDK